MGTLMITRNTIDTAEVTPLSYADSREAWLEHRLEAGWIAEAPYLSPPSSNHKLGLSSVPTYGLSLAPHYESGHNVCVNSTPVCRQGCVSYAGNGGRKSVQYARRIRTTFAFKNPAAAAGLIVGEAHKIARRHDEAALRLNTNADLAWETMVPELFDIEGILFYDYTKRWDRETTDRYWLTYSRTERTPDVDILEACSSGRNVAVVFSTPKGEALPSSYLGLSVVDGDVSDLRTSDPRGVIVGLRAKGRLRHDTTSGFVVNP